MALRMLSATAASVVVTPPRPYLGVHGLGICTRNRTASVCRWSRISFRVGSVKCKALGESSQSQSSVDRTVYQGIYGPWTVDSSDVREVILYRSGLVTAAASFLVAASAAFFPGNSSLGVIIKQNLDFLYVAGAGGLGLSLFLIHIYITEIKRTLQALWALGVLGSLVTYTGLAHPVNVSLVQYVLDNPSAVWLIGPLFAALTGLVFKEGLCYGKLEAGVLTFIIPIILLGHLTGLMGDEVKLDLLASWMVLFVIFAGRKFTQPLKILLGVWKIGSS
ncbi:Integral membrane protein [Quillaja saponaria]|uniref:Integral membrane protein n=1 Tax=Quillaja saponaria TaxID=32244 RepID=A0AAD7LAP3_QUISA|nr:Integral membrane protein [Quillaja saponaria]